jgi:hypothetical protein
VTVVKREEAVFARHQGLEPAEHANLRGSGRMVGDAVVAGEPLPAEGFLHFYDSREPPASNPYTLHITHC